LHPEATYYDIIRLTQLLESGASHTGVRSEVMKRHLLDTICVLQRFLNLVCSPGAKILILVLLICLGLSGSDHGSPVAERECPEFR